MNGYALASMIALMCFACAGDPTGSPPEQREALPERAPDPSVKPEAAADPEQLRAAAAEELLTTAEALAELHRRHAEDCPALAKAITDFHAERGQTVAEVPADVHALIDREQPLRERLRSAMESVMSASMACRDDPTFAAAQAEIFGESTNRP